jgi:hypothetical protein
MPKFYTSKFYFYPFLILGIFNWMACEKVEGPPPQKATEAEEVSTAEHTLLESIIYDVLDVENEIMQRSDILTAINSISGANPANITKQFSCAEIVISLVIDNSGEIIGKRLEIDFGSNGCNIRNKVRKGRIIWGFLRAADVMGNPLTTNEQEVITIYDEYEIDNLKIAGNNMAYRISSQFGATLSHFIRIYIASMVYSDGKRIAISGDRVRNYFDNRTPTKLEDDFFLLNGQMNGINSQEKLFSSNITGSLKWRLACNQIFVPVQGILTLDADDRPAATVDFGGGGCDHFFTTTIQEKVKNIDASSILKSD